MGRTLKRVPLDFTWPLGQVWGGYLNPFSRQSIKCPDCNGSGYSPDAARFSDEWYGHGYNTGRSFRGFDPVAYGATPLTVDHPAIRQVAEAHCERDGGYYGHGDAAIFREQRRLFALFREQWLHQLIQADVDALVEAGRLMELTRRPRTAEHVEKLKAQESAGGSGYWLDEVVHRPTADEVNTWSIVSPMAHDSINQWACVEARCKREGVEKTCARCGGSGELWPTPEIEKLHDEWQPTEPPSGDGYQLWETTSEGSPNSPVFATLDELCAYAAVNCTTFGTSNFVSAEKWREMLDADFVRHEEPMDNGTAVFL